MSPKLAKIWERKRKIRRDGLERKSPEQDAIWTAETAMALADKVAEHPAEWREYLDLRETIWVLALAGMTDMPLQPRYRKLARLFRG